MRIERTGPVDKLTPRMVAFLREDLGAIVLDDVQSAETERIDFTCFRGLLAVELKTLEGAPSERTSNFVDSLRDRPDFPTFFGTVDAEAVFKNMDNPDALRRNFISRIGRPIITHLKKANSQLSAHEVAFPRSRRVRILLMLNEDHSEYHPEIVAWIVAKAFDQEREDGAPRYNSLDAVIYISERHAVPIEGQAGLSILSIHGPSTVGAPWKEEVLGHFVRRWAIWNEIGLFVKDDGLDTGFVAMDIIPDTAPLHEAWRIAYRRNPHMRPLSTEQLRMSFDEVMVIMTLFAFKSSPMKISKEQMAIATERFTHIQMEMHHRALPMEKFDHDPKRQHEAAIRLGLPANVISWFQQQVSPPQ